MTMAALSTRHAHLNKPTNGRLGNQQVAERKRRKLWIPYSATPQSTVGPFLASLNSAPFMFPVTTTVTSTNTGNLSYLSSQRPSLPAFTAFSAELSWHMHLPLNRVCHLTTNGTLVCLLIHIKSQGYRSMYRNAMVVVLRFVKSTEMLLIIKL